MNAANIMKPALSRGQMQVIGATTFAEYRKYIEKDSALERRFQPVKVEEPSLLDTIEVIKGIRVYYEKHHCVRVSDPIVTSIVKLSERYITDRFRRTRPLTCWMNPAPAATCAILKLQSSWRPSAP